MPKGTRMSGYFFEDYEVGAIFKHWPGRTITETDNTWITLITMNTHPIHFDVNFASKQEFGKPLVNSGLTLAMIGGMSVTDISQNAVANLGWEETKIPRPTFVGDTIYAETVILERRESKSRPNCGIIRVETIGRNQHGEVIMSFIRTILMRKKPSELEAKIYDDCFTKA